MPGEILSPTTETLLRQRDRLSISVYVMYALVVFWWVQFIFPGVFPRALIKTLLIQLFAMMMLGIIGSVMSMRYRRNLETAVRANQYRFCPKCCFPSDRGDTSEFQCTECGDTYSTQQIRNYLVWFGLWPKPPKPLRKGEHHA